MTSYATQRFRNLPPEKSTRVLAAAITEFADHGYQHANTNRIAEVAGVSVGALFKYFDTKDALFRYVIAEGAQVIEGSVTDLLAQPGDVIDKIRMLLQLAVDTAIVQREYVRLYHEITATGNQSHAQELAMQLEGFTSSAYTQLLRQAQIAGEIRDDLDPAVLAFCLDNLLMGLQLAYACDYHIDRRRIYSADIARDDLIEQTLRFISSAIRRSP